MTQYCVDTVRLEDKGANSQIVGRCVKFQPTFKNNQNVPKPKRFPIDQMDSLRDQEAVIFQDLLSVLVGLEGFYIRYSESFDFENLKHRLSGPDFLINKHLDPSLKDITKRINSLGKYYFSLESFVELHDNVIYGQTIQALCYEIRELIKKYEQLLVQIEHEYHSNPNYSLNLLEQDLSISIMTEWTHMYEIVQKINKENEHRMDSSNVDAMKFDRILKSLKDDYYTGSLDSVTSDSRTSRFVKGGLVLNIIHEAADHYRGNVTSHKFLSTLLNNVSLNYVEALNNWLNFGIINDPYDEFLIHQTHNKQLSAVSENYWAEKFTIRDEGLPVQFASKDIQKFLILTGKYLNVLKESGIDIRSLNTTKIEVKTLQDSDLHIIINEAYKRANKYITDLLVGGYHIKEFLQGLNKHFLLNNSHDFNDFLNCVSTQLKRPKGQTSISALIKQYQMSFARDGVYISDSSLFSSKRLIYNLINLEMSKDCLTSELTMILNAQTTDAEKVFSSTNISSLKEVLNSTIEANNNQSRNTLMTNTKIDEYSIHNFTLDIEVPFPINLIVTRSQVFEYKLIGRHVMFLKFVEKSLEQSWREIGYQKFWAWKFKSRRLRSWITRTRIIHTKFRDFIKIFLFYINYDVIETNWQQVETTFDGLATADSVELQYVFISIKSFLSTVLTESLLTKVKLVQVVNQLLSIILLFHNFVMSMRKSLILMDENLYLKHQSTLTSSTEYDPSRNNTRLNRIEEVLNTYRDSFDIKLTDLMDALKYYGEVDTPALLKLFDQLAATFGNNGY
ncbi:hypothetical protein CANARDRAFT_28905 [[Candida] arabinofermentans NRRL YB-2248]|uniref:Spindle pole body component n=1 Tax=[Candida] arabinofermentans NRRL YB-2248 TaxID=983967 RepID=A0A1E4SZ27_9ASCO|nr:hypothetical protein CANARDRAFT_28905 [[Candida] arabinofermentans NRRL YB-2248]